MKKILLLAVSCFCVSVVNAQSEYKKWVESEKKESTYTSKEIKKAAKEFAPLTPSMFDKIVTSLAEKLKLQPDDDF